MPSMMKHLAVLACGAFAAATIVGSASAADKPKMFNLSSPTVRDGGMLAKKNAGNNPNNKNCDGQNVSIPLKWSNPPEGTKSYVLLMFDPVARPPIGVVHWLAYDIPVSKTGFKEGETSNPATAPKSGKSTVGQPTYFGPCPPFGDKPHPYMFMLWATDLEPGSLNAGMTLDELAKPLQGHIKGSTNLITRYGH